MFQNKNLNDDMCVLHFFCPKAMEVWQKRTTESDSIGMSDAKSNKKNLPDDRCNTGATLEHIVYILGQSRQGQEASIWPAPDT